MAFRHCDGVIDVPNHLSDDGTMPVVKSKLVDAKYCEQFAHVRYIIEQNTILKIRLLC